MISDLIFNSDIFSGNILWIDNIQSTGGTVVDNSNFDLKENLIVRKNSNLFGTLDVGQDATFNSDAFVQQDFYVNGKSDLSGTLNVDQDATLNSGLFVKGDARIEGDLYVSGDKVIMETSTVRVEDKNIELAVLDSATDFTADGGGLTLKGSTDKTISWSNATDSWDVSEHLGVADGKYIFSDKLRARDTAGLSLEDDDGNGIFIEDGGDVGIGTTNPSVGLEINHTDALKIPKGTTVQRPTSNSTTHKGYIRYNTTTDQFEGFGAGNAWGSLGGVIDVDQDTYVSAEDSAGADNDELKFFTSGNQRAVIKSNGNVGIGTTDPGANLEIKGGSEPLAIYDATDEKKLRVFTAANGTVLSLTDGGEDIIRLDGRVSTPNISYFNGGNVGIGTTSPTNALNVIKSSTSGVPVAWIHNSNNTAAGNFGTVVSCINNNSNINVFQVRSNNSTHTNGNALFTVKGDGKVGIGTTGPSDILDLTAAAHPTIFLNESTNSYQARIGIPSAAGHVFSGNASVGTLAIRNDSGIQFGTSTPVLTINSSDNVGIGTTSPGERLDVNGRIRIENSTAPTTTSNRLYAVGGNLFWNGEDVLHARDTIGEMEDTSIGTKSNGQLLIWNATSSKWVNNTLTGGGAIDVTNAAGGITISHSDTSTASSSSNSGRTYIQDIEIDAYGHVTSINTATETVVDTNTTYSAGSGLSLIGTAFSINSDQKGNIAAIGRDANDSISIETTSIDFKLDGALDMQLKKQRGSTCRRKSSFFF